MEAEIGAAVRDYLEYIDLNKTAESFDNELQALGRPLPQTEGAQSLKEEVKVRTSIGLYCCERLMR